MSAVLERAIERPEPASAEEEERDTGVRPFRWTVRDYYRAVRADLFDHPERLELIEGEIFEKVAAQETPHCQATGLTADELKTAFGEICHIRTQMPIDVSEITEPEPDVTVIRGSRRDYDHHKPTT